MITRRVRITTENGAHARPVAELARLALEHSSPVHLTAADGSTVDLSSVLAVMELDLGQGEEVVLQTMTSSGAEQVLAEMAKVLDPTLNFQTE